jgi:hypothetical protein
MEVDPSQSVSHLVLLWDGSDFVCSMDLTPNRYIFDRVIFGVLCRNSLQRTLSCLGR